jgi:hypothetical protein
VTKENPFGPDSTEAAFEAMKRRAQADAQARSGFDQLQRVQTAAMQRQLQEAQQYQERLQAQQQYQQRQYQEDQQRRYQEAQAQRLASERKLSPGTPVPLTEGVPSAPIRAYLDRLAGVREIAARVRRGDGDAADRDAEEARLGLGAALSQAILSGLLSETTAVDMIVAGGINDQPMEPQQARRQVVAALAQAFDAGAMTRAEADQVADILGAAGPPTGPQDRDPPSQGRTRPTGPAQETPDEQGSRDELLARIDRLEDLLYAALTVRPCHLPEHAERHRDSDVPCTQQGSGALAILLAAVDVPPTALPRAPHVGPDGARARCCARDGNLGTWLVYGRTLDPQARFSSEARGEPSQ